MGLVPLYEGLQSAPSPLPREDTARSRLPATLKRALPRTHHAGTLTGPLCRKAISAIGYAQPTPHCHQIWVNVLKTDAGFPESGGGLGNTCTVPPSGRGTLASTHTGAQGHRALPVEGKEPTSTYPGAPPHSLVVGRLNVCDGDLLKFLSCPPQGALLAWNWRVDAAMRTFNVKLSLYFFKIKEIHPRVKNNPTVQTN